MDRTEYTLSIQDWLRAFEWMLLVRRFEEKCGQLYGMGKIAGFCHLYIGQEAVVVGAALTKNVGDSMITGYRDHGHALVCGIEPKHVLAELMGKAGGCSKGKGGSMHIFNKKEGFFGGHGIVGSQVPIGTGIAFAQKYLNTGKISYTFFGDGAANQGQVFEAFNMAKLWNLPVFYIIENNGYAMGTSVDRSTYVTNLSSRGDSFGIDGVQVNGMKIDVLYNAFQNISLKIRNGSGPQLLEAKTYRFRGHSMSDPAKYRSKDEIEEYKQEDPILYAKNYILENGVASDVELKKIEHEIKEKIREAVDFAEKSPLPDAKELFSDVLIDNR